MYEADTQLKICKAIEFQALEQYLQEICNSFLFGCTNNPITLCGRKYAT